MIFAMWMTQSRVTNSETSPHIFPFRVCAGVESRTRSTTKVRSNTGTPLTYMIATMNPGFFGCLHLSLLALDVEASNGTCTSESVGMIKEVGTHDVSR